jgi:hypothetical protein
MPYPGVTAQPDAVERCRAEEPWKAPFAIAKSTTVNGANLWVRLGQPRQTNAAGEVSQGGNSRRCSLVSRPEFSAASSVGTPCQKPRRRRDSAARTGVWGLRRSPLRYFAAVLALSSGLGFSNYASDLWSYGDSNPRPLACHARSARRHMWLDVALCGVHLRLPWLDVAWRRLVSLHVGSPLGSQNSLAQLMCG